MDVVCDLDYVLVIQINRNCLWRVHPHLSRPTIDLEKKLEFGICLRKIFYTRFFQSIYKTKVIVNVSVIHIAKNSFQME